ncbi:DNA polymerase III subunit delta' [Azospira restricta]|uniref:DNA polymerase III subunit delta n=1 Tax=Azospira restricta TaxID=404405 RepID=A0A974SMT7_9RHOO|nr:DNA polymerase III subunit delta' [Azospira restricta]QRJ62782.1 DNA polymerase III subunit delta' [Azospira restricta]
MNVIQLHSDLWSRLQARRRQLPHSLLLGGARGLGKFDLARAFAASLLCENPQPNGEACGQCLACNWLSQGNHPDFRLLQPEALAEAEGEGEEGGKKASQQITIDQVRGLDDFLHVGTHRAGLRVVLVCPAEAMNRNTANALLKTLEEPAPDTLFLLVSHEPERLLPTIRSRCQALAVPTPDAARARDWLAAAGVADAERWLALAGGAPLLAAELDGSGERRLIEALLEQLLRGPALDPLAAAAALDKTVKAEKGGGAPPMKRLMEWAQKWLVDLSLAATRLPVRYFVGERAQIEKLAARSDAQRLLAFGRKALQYRRHSEHPLNSRLFLEDFFLGYAALFERR